MKYKINKYSVDLLIDYYENFDQAGQEGFISEESKYKILEFLDSAKKIGNIDFNILDKNSADDIVLTIESLLAQDCLDIEHLEACKINSSNAKQAKKDYKKIINNIQI